MFRKLFVSILAATACSAAVAEPVEINFGIISTESSANLKADWLPILDDMQKKTGYKVNGYFANDYAGIIEGMRFGKVHLAWYGNKSGMEAVDRASGEVFAQITYADGSPGYYSLLVTHKDSPYKTLADVLKHGKDITYGAGDPNSTSGTLVPGYYLYAQNGIDPKTHYKSMRVSNHESNLMAAAAKQVDVAITNSEAFGKLKTRNSEKAESIRILWKSPLIANDPIVWRTDLPADVKAKMKEFFMSYGRGDSAEAKSELAKLNKLTFGVFNESSDKQLVPFRQLELVKAKAKIEADENMDAATKQAKLAEIAKKLAALSDQLAAK